MGAKNHQPTSTRITAVSAWLSQRVGEGSLLVQEANNHLENAIILGMNKLYVEDLVPSLSGTPCDHLRKTIDTLKRSQEINPQIQLGFARLSEVARIENYVGNPLASRLKAFDLSHRFVGVLVSPTINMQVWRELEHRITNDNIMKTLEWEARQFQTLTQPTQDFSVVIENCLKIATSEGGVAFVDAVEGNEIPVRQYGARLLSLWNNLDAMFLYSALMMTELFYRANAYPSLLEFNPINKGSRVA